MKLISGLVLTVLVFLLFSCSGDIKGEKGAAGADASAIALLTLHRPPFQSSLISATTVIVSGSASQPSKVLMDSTVYSNSTDAGCDLTKSGRGGLDVGSAAANHLYYLYAIPAASGSTFDLLTSTTSPDTGPTGFSIWTYLGAFVSDVTSEVIPFNSSAGFYMSADGAIQTGTTTSATPVPQTLLIPSFATKAWMRCDMTSYITGGDKSYIQSTSGGGTISGVSLFAIAFDTGLGLEDADQLGWVSILTPQTVWTAVYQAGASAPTGRFVLFGWQEDAAQWP